MGCSTPTLQPDTIRAETSEKAKAAFEKKYPNYTAAACDEIVDDKKKNETIESPTGWPSDDSKQTKESK